MALMNRGNALIGLVIGIVFIIIGFSYENPGVWIPGLILLALGIWLRSKKE